VKLRLPKTLFGRMLLSFVLILALNQVAVLAVTLSIGALPIGRELGFLSSALVTAVESLVRHGNADEAELTEWLRRQTGLEWSRGTMPTATPPDYPLLRQWRKTLRELWGDRLEIGYQAEPTPMLWLRKTATPTFALGLPVDNVQIAPRFLATLWLLAAGLGVAAAWWVARHLNRPLNDLAAATRRLGRDRRAVEINPRGPEEIRALGQALNGLSADLDHLVRKQELLLAGISHDLRTPLTRLRLAVEMLDPASSDLLNGMREDVEEMNAILQQFIDLARCNIEETEPWVEGDINRVLCEVQENYRRVAIHLRLVGAETPPVRYKPLALKRLLYNLIDNGLKHGGGQVTLATLTNGERVQLCVSDCGPGFSEAARQRLQSAPARPPAGGSGGLGLLIVQRIAELHEAELTVRNGVAGGAEVWVGFPRRFHSRNGSLAKTMV
jgi:two-component system osmolarity sensor histidine kinase EnvZ